MANHEKSPRYNTVIWDWDGTLGMTLEEWVAGYKEVFSKPSVSDPTLPRITATRSELIESMGSFRRRIHEYWEQSKEVADELVAEAHALVAPRLEKVALYPNAKRTVHRLGSLGILQAVASKSHRKVVEAAAKYRGIHAPMGAFVGGNELHESMQKPHPESVTLALRRLKLGEGGVRAVIIGDSLTDLETAQRAKVDSILYYPPENEAFYNLARLKEGRPTHIIRDLSEAIDIIAA